MAEQNSINNIITDNDFSVSRTLAGTACVNSIEHSDNSSTTSHSELRAEVGGTSGGDPFLRFSVSGAQDYSFGIDNSDSDILKITDDADPSTGNSLWAMTSAGERTMPKQVAFTAYLPTDDGSETGDGTLFQIGSTTALTEVFDQNADFNTNGTFTAPVTGMYALSGTATFIDSGSSTLNVATLIIGRLNTSNNNFQLENTEGTLNTNTNVEAYATCISAIADMDAADTFVFEVAVTSAGGKNVGLAGNGSTPTRFRTYMSGYLLG